MENVLQSETEILQFYRKMYPVDAKTKEYVKRMQVLKFREALCLHYEVNPFNMPVSNIPKITTASLKLKIKGEKKAIEVKDFPIPDIRRIMYLLSFFPENHPFSLNPNEQACCITPV